MTSMPLAYHSLVVENTSRCNARCGMCYQAAGPRGSDLVGDHQLDEAIIADVLHEALSIRTLEPRFHLAGGESFLDAEGCIRLISTARAAGYAEVSTTTNAFWARNPTAAGELTQTLRAAGLTTMEISWDHWHRPFVSRSCVENAIHACFFAGIQVNLRILSTRAHSYHEALSDIGRVALGRVAQITAGPVFPTGRAASAIPREEFHAREGALEGTCHGTLNLTVRASGDVYPCCAGLDQTKARFGNVRTKSIGEIARDLDQSLLVRLLVFGGPLAIADVLAAHGVDVGRDFANICHQCSTIFARQDWIDILDRHFRDAVADTFLRAATGASQLPDCPKGEA